jgi:hypothetical protein
MPRLPCAQPTQTRPAPLASPPTGPLRTLLFWLRPGLALSVLLLLAGASAALGGSGAAVALLLLACLLRRWVAEAEAGGQAGRGTGQPYLMAGPYGKPTHVYDNRAYGREEDAVSYSLARRQVRRCRRALAIRRRARYAAQVCALWLTLYGVPYGAGVPRGAAVGSWRRRLGGRARRL